jgi:hypothetical protein
MSSSVRVMPLLQSGEFASVVGCLVQRPDEPWALFDEARRRGLAAERIVLREFGLAWDMPPAVRRLRSLGIGIIHSHDCNASVPGSAIHRLAAIPIFATGHLWFIGPGNPFRMKFMAAMEMSPYRRCRLAVAVSKEIRQVLVLANAAGECVRRILNRIPFHVTPLGPATPSAPRTTLGARDDGYGRHARMSLLGFLDDICAILQAAGAGFQWCKTHDRGCNSNSAMQEVQSDTNERVSESRHEVLGRAAAACRFERLTGLWSHRLCRGILGCVGAFQRHHVHPLR